MRASHLWGETGLTLVVLPSGIQGEKLLRVAKEWTSLRLLGPSIWIQPKEFEETKTPPAIEAIAIASTRAGSLREVRVELFRQLARQQLTRVRLIAVRPSLPDLAFDTLQDRYVELIAKYLDISVPKIQAKDHMDDEGVSLVKLNLITGPTEHVVPDPSEMLDPLFNAHFVAAAEDRSGPKTGDAFVKDDPESDRFAGFTLLHVATLGALWQGLPKGGYELISNSTWQGDTVYVSRVFVSAILTDGLIRRACARVIEAAADTNRGIEDLGVGLNIEGTFPIADPDVDGWLDFMVDQTFHFDDGVLQYKPVLASPTPEKTKFGFFRQLGDFGSFAFGKLLRIPYHAWFWFIAKMATLLNNLFQGGNKGSAEVTAPQERVDSKDLLLLAKYDEVFVVKQQADEALVSPVGRGKLRSTPALWANLRKMIFGLVDGSNLDQFGIKRAENGWPVFYRITSVFNDPAEKVTFSNPARDEGKVVLGWGSSAATQVVIHDLADSKKLTTTALTADLSVVVEAKQKSESLSLAIQKLYGELGLDEPAPYSILIEPPGAAQATDSIEVATGADSDSLLLDSASEVNNRG